MRCVCSSRGIHSRTVSLRPRTTCCAAKAAFWDAFSTKSTHAAGVVLGPKMLKPAVTVKFGVLHIGLTPTALSTHGTAVTSESVARDVAPHHNAGPEHGHRIIVVVSVCATEGCNKRKIVTIATADVPSNRNRTSAGQKVIGSINS